MNKIALMLLVLGLFGFLIGYNLQSDRSYYAYDITSYKLN